MRSCARKRRATYAREQACMMDLREAIVGDVTEELQNLTLCDAVGPGGNDIIREPLPTDQLFNIDV